MSSKTIQRNPISGLHEVIDGAHEDAGSYSVNELKARHDARQEALNKAIVADWPKDMTTGDISADHAAYGNAGSRLPRPTDVNGKGADRYGVSVAPGEQKAKQPSRTGKPAGK